MKPDDLVEWSLRAGLSILIVGAAIRFVVNWFQDED